MLLAIYKVHAVILERRILTALDGYLPETQYGFRPL